MITLVYRLITILIVILVAWELWRQTDIKVQATAAMILIPLLLRAAMLV